MAIEKYTTQTFIIQTYESGEHDKMYKLFTRDFGLIFAKATSIRKLESKLRAHMHVGRMSLVTLVKGKEVWRLTGAEEVREKTSFCREVALLLERFVRGEGAQKRLFDHMISLCEREGLDEKTLRLLSYYLILVDLGYADATYIGAKSMEEYSLWNMDDLYTHLVLTKDGVRNHVRHVLSEIQL